MLFCAKYSLFAPSIRISIQLVSLRQLRPPVWFRQKLRPAILITTDVSSSVLIRVLSRTLHQNFHQTFYSKVYRNVFTLSKTTCTCQHHEPSSSLTAVRLAKLRTAGCRERNTTDGRGKISRDSVPSRKREPHNPLIHLHMFPQHPTQWVFIPLLALPWLRCLRLRCGGRRLIWVRYEGLICGDSSSTSFLFFPPWACWDQNCGNTHGLWLLPLPCDCWESWASSGSGGGLSYTNMHDVSSAYPESEMQKTSHIYNACSVLGCGLSLHAENSCRRRLW